MKGDFPDFLNGLCCEFDREVNNKGKEDCDHDWYEVMSGVDYVLIECKKCGRRIDYGVWD